jgi:hypothetical protein
MDLHARPPGRLSHEMALAEAQAHKGLLQILGVNRWRRIEEILAEVFGARPSDVGEIILAQAGGEVLEQEVGGVSGEVLL